MWAWNNGCGRRTMGVGGEEGVEVMLAESERAIRKSMK